MQILPRTRYEGIVSLQLRTRLWPLVVFLALLIPPPAVAASEYQGQVVSVIDGDTLEVLNGHHTERIRLSGIDCPEKGQSYGQRGKQAASELVFGKEVTLQDSWQGQVRAHTGRCTLAGWNERQSRVGQRGLVLMVSEDYTGRYGVGRVRN